MRIFAAGLSMGMERRIVAPSFVTVTDPDRFWMILSYEKEKDKRKRKRNKETEKGEGGRRESKVISEGG